MKHYIWLLIILVTYLPHSLQGNEKITVDNLTIFDRLTAKIIKQSITRVDLKQYSKIYIKNVEQNDKNSWFIENWFIRILNNLGYDSVALYRDEFSNKSLKSYHLWQ